MPAFLFTPGGAVATAFAFGNAVQNIKKKQAGSWIFWPLAIIFVCVLLGVIGLIGLFFYYTVAHH